MPALWTVLFLLLAPHSGSSPFRSLSFEAAATLARAEGKLLFVDFYTTWCGPCRKLDQTTWQDPRVQEFLARHTQAIKVDAEAREALAKRFEVRAYPSLLFIEPDGSVRERIVGYRTADDFLELAEQIVSGGTVVELLRERLEGEELLDWNLRDDLADELVRRGAYAEALEHYLWLFDEGLEHSPAHFGVRNSFLLMDLVNLAEKYPPAGQALRERRDAAGFLLREGVGTVAHARDFCDLSERLGEAHAILPVYEALQAAGADQAVRVLLFEHAAALLAAQERHADLLAGPVSWEHFLATFRQHRLLLPAESLPHVRDEARVQLGWFYRACFALGRHEEASRIAAALAEVGPAEVIEEQLRRLQGTAGG